MNHNLLMPIMAATGLKQISPEAYTAQLTAIIAFVIAGIPLYLKFRGLLEISPEKMPENLLLKSARRMKKAVRNHLDPLRKLSNAVL